MFGGLTESSCEVKITSKLFVFAQDSQDVITTELLYACCPYLGMQYKLPLFLHFIDLQFPHVGELRSMLAEFAAGLQSKASKI